MHYNNLEILRFQEKQGSPPGYIRVLHTVPDAPDVDAYMPIPPGTYEISLYIAGSTNSPVIIYNINIEIDARTTVAVRVAGTPTVALTIPEMFFESKTVYTIYVIGFLDGSPELEALIIIDGLFI